MRLESEEDINGMLRDRDGRPDVKIYVVARKQSYALPWNPSHSQQTLQYQNEGDTNVSDLNPEKDQNEETRVEEEKVEGLVESDYEREPEPVDNTEVGSERVHFDFGFGMLNEQLVRNSDTDYEDSDDLRSIYSEEEGNRASKMRASNDALNVGTNMEDPVFKTGLIFESKAVLKAAITSHSVTNSREIKFKKDDARRLRAKCKRDCPWVLYATKEHGKASWAIKTFVEEHTYPMVYKNFRVTSSYLANRYLADWRAEQNMSVTTFMERVKRDGLGDISAWQVYRLKEKALEKIRGSVVEHYKLPWDYCEELKRTNIGTIALVEGHVGEFRQLYICIGALRDGFIRGCRGVIRVDGCFLKTELGGQLLTTIGVDANNGIYSVAYVVVEVENGDNWKWFLELLEDDLHIHNSQHWIFISDKQKGLTNAIGTLFENSEHCVRHLYNNFSVCHKGLALKNCLWDAARATTISQWRQHMQRMMDLDPTAYGWLEKKLASHWSKYHSKEWNQCDMLLTNLCE
ncbi:uncharacterized protein LOC111383052 [Olea europaea var. sylvestris]|uniref:uncharacterized protein LOC111383052 n=1 Tax=Olea europaea var. sylvestris TaxID=158386 RepID=UPI000C1D7CFD|nr:uncharacterized protein LOC111383052 [Olea europaea var. sylvestris]